MQLYLSQLQAETPSLIESAQKFTESDAWLQHAEDQLEAEDIILFRAMAEKELLLLASRMTSAGGVTSKKQKDKVLSSPAPSPSPSPTGQSERAVQAVHILSRARAIMSGARRSAQATAEEQGWGWGLGWIFNRGPPAAAASGQMEPQNQHALTLSDSERAELFKSIDFNEVVARSSPPADFVHTYVSVVLSQVSVTVVEGNVLLLCAFFPFFLLV